ncbi:MAG: pyridoxal phosphate-dependent decarboxylase family protein [Pararhodobacter sp.]
MPDPLAGPGQTGLDPADLDPQSWPDFRAAAHRLLDACIDRLEGARAHPWQPVPDAVRQGYAISAEGSNEAAIVERLVRDVLPHGTGNTHPAFWGWVHGSGLASGVLSAMVEATINANCGGRAHGAVCMERAVIDWARKVMGLPEGASGVLVTGTSQATVIALQAARLRLVPDLRRVGQGGARLVAYGGAGVHQAAAKAMELLGMGREALRLVEGGARGPDLAALRAAIARDRAEGARPFALIATAGSVDLGRFDDLHMLADLAAQEGLWLHVDGAFGAWTRLAADPWRGLSAGIERADSIACDFHKWMYVPYDCGLVLMRDEAAHRAAFAARPAYLAGQAMGLGGGDPWFCDYGIDLSRGNRALKVWTALELYGAGRMGAAISRNCELAALMGGLVEVAPGLALAAPVVSNVCVFTALAGAPADQRGAANTAIAQALQLSGQAVFSTTLVEGVTCLRAAITNHRSRDGDVEGAIAAVVAEAARVIS